MATVKAMLYTRYQSKDKTYPIVIFLIDGKKQKLHPVGYKVLDGSFQDGYVSKKHPDHKEINAVIDSKLAKAKHYIADCRIKNIPIDLDLAFSEIKSHSFTAYLEKRAAQYKAKEMIEMDMKTRRFRKEILDHAGREVYFSDINQDWLSAFEAYLIKLPNSANTRLKKFEHLSKFYSAAIKEKLVHGDNPFKDYKIKGEPVRKQKLSPEQIKSLETLDLKPGLLRLARDLFLFSYYCKGQRFETCITMSKSFIVGGRLDFIGNKGKHIFSVEIHPKLAAIIDRYITNDTDTIFGRNKVEIRLLKKEKAKYRSFLGSENANINRSLKDVAAIAEIPIELSMHHARHSLAFHLKQKRNSVGIIKDILGHSHERITEVYLHSLDDKAQDESLNSVYYD